MVKYYESLFEVASVKPVQISICFDSTLAGNTLHAFVPNTNHTIETKLMKKNVIQNVAFTLVEMLVVIATIGVIAAIAIPNINSIERQAREAKNQRNAMTIVSMYQSGDAAGVEWKGGNRWAKVHAVLEGATPTDGAFTGKNFRVQMTEEDRYQAMPYIGMDTDGDLFYIKAGGQVKE